MCRAHESSHLQARAMTVLRGQRDCECSQTQAWEKGEQGGLSRKCTKCGRNHKEKEDCPDKTAECRRCHKTGHYAAVCRSKKKTNPRTSDLRDGVRNVSAEQGEDLFAGNVSRSEKVAEECSESG
jgi:hypothetical protein